MDILYIPSQLSNVRTSKVSYIYPCPHFYYCVYSVSFLPSVVANVLSIIGNCHLRIFDISIVLYKDSSPCINNIKYITVLKDSSSRQYFSDIGYMTQIEDPTQR